MKELSVREKPLQERPREKLVRYGAKYLSDKELLAALLGSGGKGINVDTLAERVLAQIDLAKGEVSAEQLQQIPGIGLAKACLLTAAFEFARRRIRPEGLRVTQPSDVLKELQHLANRKQEHFTCTTLNGANEIIATRVVTIGLVNSCQVHPREVFSDCLTDRASAIIVAHNHPSGNLEPSSEDSALTKRLVDAAEILGIRLLDHIIFSERGYFSYQEAGML